LEYNIIDIFKMEIIELSHRLLGL